MDEKVKVEFTVAEARALLCNRVPECNQHSAADHNSAYRKLAAATRKVTAPDA